MTSTDKPRTTAAELLSRIRDVAADYYRVTGKPLGVTGEIGEVEAAERLGLELADVRTEGYDAVRGDGPRRLVQIKTRWRRDGVRPHDRLSRIDISKTFDSVVLVLMRGRHEVYEIWEADRQAVVERLQAPGSTSRNVRGQLGVSQFKSVAVKVWSGDGG